LGTIPGGAALAITGGKYISSLVNGGQGMIIVGTVIVLLIGGFLNYFGAKLSGKIQQLLAGVLVVMLSGVAAIAIFYGDTAAGDGIAPLSQAMGALPTVGMVFFAFVGWELMSFTTEEFKNPKRDFPLMIAISLVIVVALYLMVAVAIQLIIPPTHPDLARAPIASMLAVVLGKASGRVISVLGVLMAMANFTSVVWAFSRLSFASAREGLLPRCISRIDDSTNVPRNAVLASIIAFATASFLYFNGIASQELLFELAGISFFMSYLLAVMAYIKRSANLGSINLVS